MIPAESRAHAFRLQCIRSVFSVRILHDASVVQYTDFIAENTELPVRLSFQVAFPMLRSAFFMVEVV